jgi:uncharacterized membrane protein YcaP (DUF421 family)
MEEGVSIFETIDTFVKLITILTMLVSIGYSFFGKGKTLSREMKLINFIIILCIASVITSLFALKIFSMFLWVIYSVMWYVSGRITENKYLNMERRKNGEYGTPIDFAEILEEIKDKFTNIRW